MIDPQTYRASERLAKSQIPSWRVAQVHNIDIFEKVGFPVRIESVRELGQVIDTMQENRFGRYMEELGGLSQDEYALFIEACRDSVRFQLSYLPHRKPVLPVSTLLSAFSIYRKLKGANPDFRSVLEIGPGCGYVSHFLKHHDGLRNYSQIEACESFYVLQNLVNLHCFAPWFDERALPHEDTPACDIFSSEDRDDYEVSPTVSIDNDGVRCTHYPWWRIGELVSKDIKFDLVTSNANLLEFSPNALRDYLTLTHTTLRPQGVFLVQCTGFEAHGNVDYLLDRLHDHGFAPLMFVREGTPASPAKEGALSGIRDMLVDGTLSNVKFATNNAVFVRAGHPLFEKYYERKNYHTHFIAPEPIVRSMFYTRPPKRQMYEIARVLEDTERGFNAPLRETAVVGKSEEARVG